MRAMGECWYVPQTGGEWADGPLRMLYVKSLTRIEAALEDLGNQESASAPPSLRTQYTQKYTLMLFCCYACSKALQQAFYHLLRVHSAVAFIFLNRPASNLIESCYRSFNVRRRLFEQVRNRINWDIKK